MTGIPQAAKEFGKWFAQGESDPDRLTDDELLQLIERDRQELASINDGPPVR